jgi:hypothetical protein
MYINSSDVAKRAGRRRFHGARRSPGGPCGRGRRGRRALLIARANDDVLPFGNSRRPRRSESKRMTYEELSVEDVLQTQAEAASRTLCTVDVSQRGEEWVKLTPYIPGVGCSCASSVDLPKSAISSLQDTGERHLCCGKTLTVLSVRLADESAAQLLKTVATLTERATTARSAPPPETSRRSPQDDAISAVIHRLIQEIPPTGVGRPMNFGPFTSCMNSCWDEYTICLEGAGGNSALECECKRRLQACIDTCMGKTPTPYLCPGEAD